MNQINMQFPRPNHPKLAKIYDQSIIDGKQIRYSSDTKLVVWEPINKGSCLWVLFLLTLAMFTLGIALLLGLLGAMDNGGILTTYTVTRTGRVKKKWKRTTS